MQALNDDALSQLQPETGLGSVGSASAVADAELDEFSVTAKLDVDRGPTVFSGVGDQLVGDYPQLRSDSRAVRRAAGGRPRSVDSVGGLIERSSGESGGATQEEEIG